MNLTPYLSYVLHGTRLAGAVIESYCERVRQDYEHLAPHLPDDVTSFLDIGCGWGGHALYLAKHYGRGTEVFLIEGEDEVKKEQTGYRASATPYRDGRIAVQLLQSEGFKTTLYPVNEQTPDLIIPVDLITSFCSYGHHYPISTYLDLVCRSLAMGNHLLVDIRSGTQGIQELVKAGFVPVQSVKSKPKFERILFRLR